MEIPLFLLDLCNDLFIKSLSTRVQYHAIVFDKGFIENRKKMLQVITSLPTRLCGLLIISYFKQNCANDTSR